MEDVTLEFAPDALEYIVGKAMEYKLGARGLRSICEAIMTDIMFEIPSNKDVKQFTITLEYAQNKFERSAFYQLKLVA